MTRVVIQGTVYEFQSVGGVNRCLNEWVSRIARRCPDIGIMLDLPDTLASCPPNIPAVRRVMNWRRTWPLANLQRRWNHHQLRRFAPHVWHSTYYTTPPLPGVSTVVSAYDFVDERTFPGMSGNDRGFVEQKRTAIEKADAVIAISEATKQDILRYTDAKEDRVTVIWLSCAETFAPVPEGEVALFRQRQGLRDPYWLYVGHREFYKNFSLLLRAWARVRAAGAEARLVLIGREPRLSPWQTDFLIRHRLENQLTVLTRVDDQTLRNVYAGATALVYPSLCEGFGIPLVEAMSCGCPLVASDIPAFREVAAEAALFFDPHDEEALADRMMQVLEPAARGLLQAKGFERRRVFSWDKSADALASVYRTLARQGSP